MTRTDVLFEPVQLKGMTLPNRIVLAPLARHRAVDGVVGPDSAAYYRRRAEAGVGLIITEGCFIDHPVSGDVTDAPILNSREAFDGLQRVAQEVHAAGGRIFAQLWHIGLAHGNSLTPGSSVDGGKRRLGPSGLSGKGDVAGEPMTQTEIDEVIASYGRAAAAVKRLGFDGLEIHAGHGYLVDQFFWERTNRRADKYGGDPVARTRFAVEILHECRRAVGPDFPISMRISQWKIQDYGARLASTPDALARFLEPLVDAGTDIFHCSAQRFWISEFTGSPLNLAGWVKKLTGKPTMTVGSVSLDRDVMDMSGPAYPTGIEALLERLERGEFDLVAIGRALVVNPDWIAKIRRGAIDELRPFSYAEMASLE